jgi:glyoxylase I family protein
MARIEHFALFTNDLEALRDYYAGVFGLRVLVDNSRAPVRGYFMADEAGTVIELIERPPGQAGTETRYTCHVALWVDDYEAARAVLAARGTEFEAETRVATPEFRTEFFRDPAGNRCQIVWRDRPLGST